ncbi:restriction endonuclease subunit S, partial [Pediococcus inopinatus]
MSEQKQPKVRFSGFDDAWEQCTLKDVSARITRKNSNLESNLPLTISAQDGLVDQNTFFGKTIASKDTTGYFLLKKGEFAYNKSYSKGYPFGAVKRLDKYDEGVLSTLYIVFAPRHISSTFLAVYYDSKSWYKEIYRNAAEGARNHGLLNISSSDFFDSKLTIPSDKNEQRFIGRFIKTIDKLIAANQRQLEELKTIKKLAMQKIFDQEWRFNGFTDAWEQR